MTLRRRIAGTAGLAVAIVVLGVAIGVYVAVRSQLRGEVDTALRERARPLAESVAHGPNGRRPGRGGPGNLGVSTLDFAPPRPGEGDPGRFGGAQGYVQFVAPDGTAQLPADEAAALPARTRSATSPQRGAARSCATCTSTAPTCAS